jgi:hypothetical protein
MAEKYMKKWMDEEFPEFKYQKKIDKYTVDWFLDYYYFVIILECDENSHCSYDSYKEFYRMVKIRENLKIPIYFIRFCPNVFNKNKWNLIKYVANYRLNKLKKSLNIVMEANKICNDLIVEYFYYGRFCMNKTVIKKYNYKKIIDFEKDMIKKLNLFDNDKTLLEIINGNKLLLRKLNDIILS